MLGEKRCVRKHVQHDKTALRAPSQKALTIAASPYDAYADRGIVVWSTVNYITCQGLTQGKRPFTPKPMRQEKTS